MFESFPKEEGTAHYLLATTHLFSYCHLPPPLVLSYPTLQISIFY